MGNYIVKYPKPGYFFGLVFEGSAAAKIRRNASSGLLTFSFNTRVSGRPRLRLCSGLAFPFIVFENYGPSNICAAASNACAPLFHASKS